MGRLTVALAVVAAAVASALAFVPAPPAAALEAPAPMLLTGVDAHDGMVYRSGSTYYLVGTAYGCGFQWDPAGAESPFCGFSVYQSSDAQHWQFVRTLFEPGSTNPWAGMTWQTMCAGEGDGCFNPRMVQRHDGVWILTFNAPYDYRRGMPNAYYFMGCNGPAGPCGDTAGKPYGTTHKPVMQLCYGNGDFTIVGLGGTEAWIYCTQADHTLSSEKLDHWWTNGVGVGAHNLAGVRNVEAPGVALVNGRMTLTFSQPNCGYCSGTGTGYAIQAPSGRWLYKGKLSTTSCSGQPRTMFWLGGRPWLWIDQWTGGQRNQTDAPIAFVPIGYDAFGNAQITCPALSLV
jgi:beta-xylosidase